MIYGGESVGVSLDLSPKERLHFKEVLAQGVVTGGAQRKLKGALRISGRCATIDTLSRDFGGKVNFWCPVDIQTTLQIRAEKAIEREAEELIEKLGCFGGGFMAGHYSSDEAIGLDPTWQDLACRAFVRYGSRSLNADTGTRARPTPR